MIPKYALSAAALLQLAHGQITIKGENAAELDGEQFAEVQESANMTASNTFTGRDVSASYPGEPQEGWQLRLAIKDDIDVGDDEQQVASTISLEGPDGSVDIDDSWNMCVYVYPIKESSGSGFGSEYEPDCTALVAPECVDDILKRGREHYGTDCPTISLVPSCLRDLVEDYDGDSIRINGTY